MKTIKHIKYLLLAVLVFTACSEDVQPITSVTPQATFDVNQSVLTAAVNEVVQINATITSSGKVSSQWYVDGQLEATTTNLNFKFASPGSHSIKYVAKNRSGEFTKEFSVNVSDVLAIELSIGDSTTIVRKQLDKLQVMAIVVSGANVTHKWSVDGDVKSTEQFFNTVTFNEVGQHTVSYEGRNDAGLFTHDFTVDIVERPLEISFSITDEVLVRLENEMVEITATVLYGGLGVVHEWKVDDVVVSTTNQLSYKCQTLGRLNVEYNAVNALNESVSRKYVVNVSDGSWLIDNYEGLTSLPSRYVQGNTPGVSLVDNPSKSGINTSDRVLYNTVAGTGGTSGFFTIKVDDIPNMANYTKLRFKLYRTSSVYFPRIEAGDNGVKLTPVNNPSQTGVWEVVEFVFPAGNHGKFVIRPMLNQTGGNASGGDRKTWFDDFELLP